jgi:hypothetical protein
VSEAHRGRSYVQTGIFLHCKIFLGVSKMSVFTVAVHQIEEHQIKVLNNPEMYDYDKIRKIVSLEHVKHKVYKMERDLSILLSKNING